MNIPDTLLAIHKLQLANPEICARLVGALYLDEQIASAGGADVAKYQAERAALLEALAPVEVSGMILNPRQPVTALDLYRHAVDMPAMMPAIKQDFGWAEYILPPSPAEQKSEAPSGQPARLKLFFPQLPGAIQRP